LIYSFTPSGLKKPMPIPIPGPIANFFLSWALAGCATKQNNITEHKISLPEMEKNLDFIELVFIGEGLIF
jgi:hypothetical protein